MQIYADNAATTKMSEAAIEAMTEGIRNWWGNPSSLYTIGQKAKEKLEEAREEIAAVINASPREIIFTSGGSEADNQALLTTALNGKKQGKTHIISSAFEHHAILHMLNKLEKNGFEITLLPVHDNGIIMLDELEAAIREDTCLVTIMTANNEIGTIQPIAEIGEICRKHGVLFQPRSARFAGSTAFSSTPTRFRRSVICRSTSRRSTSTCSPPRRINSTVPRAWAFCTRARESSCKT